MKKAHVFSLFAAFLLIVFGFQNCSAPLQEEGGAAGSSTTVGSSGGFETKINFAFDTEVDQIGYMSCHQLGQGFDRSQYFTFRVGAYNTGGVRIEDQFLSEVAPAPAKNHKFLLTQSPSNKNAQPMLSIRNPDDAQRPYVSVANGAPSLGADTALMLSPLTDDPVASRLLSNPSNRIRYQSTGVPPGLRIEGDLNMNNGIVGLEGLQNALNNGALIAVNYKVSNNDLTAIRGPARYFSGAPSINTNVYGGGLKVYFKRHPAAGSGAPPWLLSTVDYLDMETRAPQTGRMSCPASLAFKIIDPRHLTSNASNTDTTKAFCETKPDNYGALSSADQELLRRARLTLRVEDWYIDWSRKCIVPKKAGTNCYGSNDIPVEYDPAKSCVTSPSTTSVRACAAFASICLR